MPTKQGKRILTVTVRKMFDECPDTSYMGEYKSNPDGEYSIDRATDEFQKDIDAGMEWLDRIESQLEDMRTVCEDHITETAPDCEECESETYYTRAIDAIRELKDGEPFDVSWDAREYRYFVPSDNYKGLPEEDIRKYTMQDYKRMESLNNGNWCYLGIRADAEIGIGDLKNFPKKFDCTVQKITSGGLWGIESDSEESYFQEVEGEQLEELKGQLLTLGFSRRAISKAFQTIEHKDN